MVDLPGVPRTVSTVQAPRTAVSPGEVAAPYQELANNLDKAGEAFQSVADTQAEKAGANAVRTDDQGNYVVDKAPYIIGQASESYSRAARFSYLAKVTPQIQDKMTELQLAHANDPAGLRKATDEYTKSVAGNVSDPLLRGPVEKVAAEAASHAYRSALVSTDATTRANALTGIQSQLASINEQSTALARQGGTDTPEYMALAKNRAALMTELGSDPSWGYPKERIAQELKASRDADVVQYIIGDVVRKYKTKQNLAEAREELQDKLWGPGSDKFGLSIHQRDAGVVEGTRALASMTAEEKAGAQENRAAAGDYMEGLKANPNAFNESAHNSQIEQAKSFNDTKLVGELQAAKTMIPLMQWAKGANEAEGTAALDAVAKNVIPNFVSPGANAGKAAFEFFKSKGYTDAQAAGIVGNLTHESGMNPNIYGDSGTSLGIAQHHAERLTALTRFAQARGKMPNDFQTQLEFIDQELNTTEAGTKAKLQAARTPEEAATAFIGFERPSGYSEANPAGGMGYQSRVALARAAAAGNFSGTNLRPGQPITDQPVAVQRLFRSTVATLREQVSKQAQASADTIVKTIEKGETLAPNELGDFANAAAATGQEAELLPKVEAALRANKAADEAEKEGQVTALKAQIAEIKGSGVDPIARNTLDQLNKQLDLNQKRLKEDPLSAGTLAHEVKSINQIDFTNPGAAATELKEREGKMKLMRQLHPEIPQTAPVIGSGEGKVIGNALISGPVDQADGFLKAASQSLSPESFQATMASPEMKNALIKMSQSTDFNRRAAGMAALDKLWQNNAPEFAQIYGANTESRMLAFNEMRDQFTPEEINARLSKADDLAETKSRKDAEAAVNAEMKKIKDPVTTLVGNFWQRQFPSFVPAVQFSQGLLDAPQAGVMVAEYTANLKALRMYGVDPDRAAEIAQKQLEKHWKQSDVAGGRIMKNRPEDFYPQINGSHDWMQSALEEDLAGAFGPRTTDVATEVGTSRAINWTVKAMVPDKQTETEIAAHRPPSYQVIVTRNGMDEAYRDPKTGNNRIAFDPTPHQAAYDKGFVSLDEYRKRVQRLRAEGADTGFVINTEKPTSTLPTPAGLPTLGIGGTRG